jgi:pyridoxal phosphate enzyme (YggS family)
MNQSPRDVLAGNLERIEARLRAACSRAGRDRRDVTLIAVTKAVPAEVAALLPGLGVLDLGESRPQELWRKAPLLPVGMRWHLVGHLQRNKIERTLPLVRRIHSVDSRRLLAALEGCRPAHSLEVFLEVNCSGETSKGGFTPAEVPGLAGELARLEHVRVVGLMTMAAPLDDPQQCRPTFALLRELCAGLRRAVGEHHTLNELSMGMSNDFEVAVEEGATSVRLGTVLFEGLPAPGGAT